MTNSLHLPVKLLLVALTLCVTLPGSRAYFSFQQLIPNGNSVKHPCKANYRWAGVGHNNPLGGGTQNVFGQDFLAMGRKWTKALCQKDSDGDGRTNGEELGDPNCLWNTGDIPEVTLSITNPGVCEPIDDPKCKDKSSFVSCELGKFEACDRIHDDDVFSETYRLPQTAVPARETNYFCFVFDLPVKQDHHIVAIEAVLDNLEVAHHMLLLACRGGVPLATEAYQCGMVLDVCSEIINGWTVGNAGYCFPDNVGYRVGKSTYTQVMIQIHWNNPYLREDYTDSSGIKVYYVPAKPHFQDAATFFIGQQILNIPPGQTSVTEVGTCPGSCSALMLSEKLYVTGVLNHMHYLGKSMKLEVFRGNKTIGVIASDPVYNYDQPVNHNLEEPFVILPGDQITTTCEFNSQNANSFVYFGDGTQDEMCFSFMFGYPASAFRQTQMCISFGDLSTCDWFTKRHVDGCDWANFLNLASPEMSTIYKALEENCNTDGFCRPKCYEVYKSFSKHPCMKGRIFQFLVGQLQNSLEGAKFLNRLLSCSGYTPPAPYMPVPQVCTQADCECDV